MTPGTRLGPYEIVAAIGAGGMGEVYRARDPRLGRDVAIKMSAERFTDRFEREARAIAALSHPHICTLHDVGPNYLVMELVDGPTLADRIAQGPISLDESLRIAEQIADALDAAHARGIVHRDLKPSNVKITTDGVVKVLDFGLAKHADTTDAEGSLDQSPTVHAATRAGVILGTAGYMAPEQARGQPVDKRADIWAFGVVVYEMLTGRQLFQGDNVSDTLAAVLTKEPAWDQLPARVQPLLGRCLVKDPRRRLRDIGDVHILLDHEPDAVPARKAWLGWGAAALLLIVLGSLAAVHFRERPPALAPMRFQIPLTVTPAASGNIAVSPDGRHLAFQGLAADGLIRIWIRELDSLDVRPLVGSETAVNAPPFFWSPDSRFIAFDAGGALKKLNISGGPAQTLCELPATFIGGSWNARGDIIIGNLFGGIMRVPAGGGAVTPVTTPDQAVKDTAHILPTFLPDGRHFVYVRGRSADASGVYVGALDAKPESQGSRQLLPYASGLAFAPSIDGGPGRLLFVREGTLMAQPFDDRRLQLAGEAVPVAEQVGVYLDTAFFSVSHNGILVYRSADPPFPVTWFDRHGSALGRVSEPGRFAGLALSPDSARAVASLTSPQDRAIADLWLFDLLRGGSPTRFTFGARVRADFPVWSPDSSRIAFRAGGPGTMRLYQKLVTAAQDENEELPAASGGLIAPASWSPDGRFLLYAQTDKATGFDLWVLPMEGAHSAGVKRIPFAHTRFNEDQGRFSPDGRWIAYVSNESGANEVYVRGFTTNFSTGSASTGGSVLVSKGGGASPHWRRDGKELFYMAPNEKMMAVGVAVGPEFRAAIPSPLFQAPPGVIDWDVTADGQRFLLVQSGAAPFTVVVNWMRN